jgi:hypothetical protein
MCHATPALACPAVHLCGVQGVNNALALKHVPEVPPREDTLAGPKGRRGDQVPICSLSVQNGCCTLPSAEWLDSLAVPGVHCSTLDEGLCRLAALS